MTDERTAAVRRLLDLARRFEEIAGKAQAAGEAAIPDRLAAGVGLLMSAASCWQATAWTLREAVTLLAGDEEARR